MSIALFLGRLVDWIATALLLLVLAHVVLSYFMSPFHQVRIWVDRLVEPLLAPIRRVVPQVGMLDFSPVVLMLAIQLLAYLIKWILYFLF